MRIAVCLSGQPRTWRTAKDNIVNFFNVPGCQVDYFIHTWDTNTYRTKYETVGEKKDYKVPIDEIKKEMEDFFKPKKIETSEYTIEKYGGNWQSLFYSFMKSVILKRQYEYENDIQYDIVIKARFDINYTLMGVNPYGMPLNKFYVHPITPYNAYTFMAVRDRFPSEYNAPSFDDVTFYADSPTMDIIANLYFWNERVMNEGRRNLLLRKYVEDASFYYGPGTLLYKHLTNWSIIPTSMFYVPYYVVRKEAEDLNLHSINDWDKISKISFDFYHQLNILEKRITE